MPMFQADCSLSPTRLGSERAGKQRRSTGPPDEPEERGDTGCQPLALCLRAGEHVLSLLTQLAGVLPESKPHLLPLQTVKTPSSKGSLHALQSLYKTAKRIHAEGAQGAHHDLLLEVAPELEAAMKQGPYGSGQYRPQPQIATEMR